MATTDDILRLSFSARALYWEVLRRGGLHGTGWFTGAVAAAKATGMSEDTFRIAILALEGISAIRVERSDGGHIRRLVALKLTDNTAKAPE